MTIKKAVFGIDAACAYLEISKPTLYRLMDSGAIRNFHIGRRRLISRDDLDQFVQRRLEEERRRTDAKASTQTQV